MQRLLAYVASPRRSDASGSVDPGALTARLDPESLDQSARVRLRAAAWLAAGGIGLGAAWIFAAQRHFLRRFTTSVQTQIAARLTLREETIPEAFRTLHPWRTLKLVKVNTRVYCADTRARITTLDMRAFGVVRVVTLLICPDDAYAFPLLSLDVVCAGPVRLAAIELIAPTSDQAAVTTLDAAHLRPWLGRLASLRKLQPSDWEQSFLLDSSVTVVADWRDDERLLAVLEGYLTTYLTMLDQALPVTTTDQERFHQGLETYVESLLTLGGPAVEGFKPIVGAEHSRTFVREVMFGLAEHEPLT
jgi:hypothetical protein